jgi:DNA-binding beta-propeller fold protein YncE
VERAENRVKIMDGAVCVRCSVRFGKLRIQQVSNPDFAKSNTKSEFKFISSAPGCKTYGIASFNGTIYMSNVGRDTIMKKTISEDGKIEAAGILRLDNIKPSGLAIDEEERLLFVTDINSRKIFVLNILDNSVIRTIEIVNNNVVENKKFSKPIRISLDTPRKRMIITDVTGHTVTILRYDGTFVEEITGFKYPFDAIVNGDNLYVADSDHYRVAEYSLRNGRYELVRFIGEHVLNSPIGLTIIGNKLFVADSYASTVQVFPLNQNNITGSCIGSRGRADGLFIEPAAVSSYRGKLIVMDTTGRDGPHKMNLFSN